MREIEVKFSEIDPDDLRARLAAAGYACTQPERLMRRQIFYKDNNNPQLYGRVRDEGHCVTMAIKNVLSQTIDGVQEAEVVIDDFDKGLLFFKMAGWETKAYQETKRETWLHPQSRVEVTIDTWPGLPPFCEIEADHEEKVRDAAKQLGFDWEQAFFGAVDVLFVHYLAIPSEEINTMPLVTFENPPQSRKTA